jgi:hypothetical protein
MRAVGNVPLVFGLAVAACGGKTMGDAGGTQAQGGAVGSGGSVAQTGGTVAQGGAAAAGGAGTGGGGSACPASASVLPQALCAPSINIGPTLIDGVPSYPVEAIPSGACDLSAPSCSFTTFLPCPPAYSTGPRTPHACACLNGAWCCSAGLPDASACPPVSCGKLICASSELCVHLPSAGGPAGPCVPFLDSGACPAGTELTPSCSDLPVTGCVAVSPPVEPICAPRPAGCAGAALKCTCLPAHTCGQVGICVTASGSDVYCRMPR